MTENQINDDKLIVYTSRPDSPFVQWMQKAMPDVEVVDTKQVELVYPAHVQKEALRIMNEEIGMPGSTSRAIAEFNDVCADLAVACGPGCSECAAEGLLCRECGQSANENWFTYGVDHYGVCDNCKVYWLMAVNCAGNALDDEMEERKRAEWVFEHYRELDPKPSVILTPRQVQCYQGGA